MSHFQKILTLLVCIVLLGTSPAKAQLDNPAEELLDANILTTTTDDGSSIEFKDAINSYEDNYYETEEMQTSFILSFLMIMVSENGDKTFLITAILAMKHSRMVVFAGAFASMLIMSVFSTLFSTLVGRLIPTYLLSKTYTDFCAALLFLIVGLHMLHEALYMEDDENDEMEEAECEVNALEARKLEELEVGGKTEYSDNAAAKAIMSDHAREGLMNLIQLLFSPVFVKTFALTFVGELGDCSQISTIALAAANVCIYYCLSHNLLP